MIATRHEAPTDRLSAVGKQGTALKAEVVAVVVSLVVIALLAAVDVVRNAPAAAPVAQATFDAAPPAVWTSLKPLDRDGRWAADESAQGTRPDAIH